MIPNKTPVKAPPIRDPHDFVSTSVYIQLPPGHFLSL
jgi:hypothetical protein